MNEPKAGFVSSEFTLACGALISNFIVAMSGADWTAKVGTGIAAAIGVGFYIYTRYSLKLPPAVPPPVVVVPSEMQTPVVVMPAVVPGVPPVVVPAPSLPLH